MLNVVLAEHAGACYGVRRAVGMAYSLLDEDTSASTLGPLIHNPIVVSNLAEQGIVQVESLDDVLGDTVIIRSHGVVPEVLDEAYARGFHVVDATCPYVSRAQKGARELARKGCHVLVVGEAGHPEVESLVAYAKSGAHGNARVDVVSCPHDIPNNLSEPVGVVVQTTQTQDTLDAVLEKLSSENVSVTVKNTICSATRDRQSAASKLAKQVDAMVVVGGKNSANTSRLAEICRLQCSNTFHIERACELISLGLQNYKDVGVTAGASTPPEQIDDVLKVLNSLGKLPKGCLCAQISDVEPSSPADFAGLSSGDAICLVNGSIIRDVIDWRWLASEESVELLVIEQNGTLSEKYLSREYGQDWGISFDKIVFDEVKTCRNACTFCFMRQLPKGLRESLVLRDDDYRLSFLTGTFTTLTNLQDEDIERILEQHLSPLRVSLHAIDSDVRLSLIGKHEGAGIMNLEYLLDAGIAFDAQIVLVPGLNDGDVLKRTLEWAYERPNIRNVGVVPLGYTRHQNTFSKSYEDAHDAKCVLDTLKPFQERSLSERGYPWVFASDEFYRNAYTEDVLQFLPDASFYGNYEMFEDGIGIIRSMSDELEEMLSSSEVLSLFDGAHSYEKNVCMYVCGEAMMPHFAQLLEASCLSQHMVPLPVKNKWLGGNVNVTGLLSGADITDAIVRHGCENRETIDSCEKQFFYAIPDIVFNDSGLTLDGYTFPDIVRNISSKSDTPVADRVFIVASNPIDYKDTIIKTCWS